MQKKIIIIKLTKNQNQPTREKGSAHMNKLFINY
jgi:hypothetical protein